MKHSWLFKGFLLLIMALSLGCGDDSNEIKKTIEANPETFDRIWFRGKAEVTRYELRQARYGQVHEGDAVLVFVTEDFLADKQVKKEHGKGKAGPVLKLNFTKKFNTGIYPYSLMTSTFTDINFDEQKAGHSQGLILGPGMVRPFLCTA